MLWKEVFDGMVLNVVLVHLEAGFSLYILRLFSSIGKGDLFYVRHCAERFKWGEDEGW